MKIRGWLIATLVGLLIAMLLLASRGLVPGPGLEEKVSSYPAPTVSATSVIRRAERATVRVRVRRCQGLFAGSGVILGDQVITNRHVVSAAREIEINTWDGSSLQIDGMAKTSPVMDIGRFPFPDRPGTLEVGERPEKGDELILSGYPRGQRLHVESGQLVGYAPGQDLPTLKFEGDVMVIDASIWRGDSGGPVLDSRGDLVGVIFAGSFDGKKKTDRSETAYAIPIDEIENLTEADFKPVKPCRLPRPASVALVSGP